MNMAMLKMLLITLSVFFSFLKFCAAENMATDLLFTNPAFQQILNRLSALETQDRIQQRRITELESRDIAQQKIITELEAVVMKQQQQLEEMESVLATKVLNKDDNQAITGDVNELNDDNGEVSARQNQGSLVTGNIPNRIRRQQAEVETVAFTAILVNSQNDLGLNQNVVFNHVETNIGNAYNQHQGVFIAPIAGTYVFHVTVFALRNAETWCKIVVNGVNKVDVYARGEANQHDQGSQTLVVRLDQGDDVSIQNAHAHDNVFGDSNTWTTFSGFLLHSDAVLSHIVGK